MAHDDSLERQALSKKHNMDAFTDFKNSVGKRFKVKDFSSGLLGQQDVIIKVNDNTQEIEGNKFIAHFSDCRFIQEVPDALNQSPITPHI